MPAYKADIFCFPYNNQRTVVRVYYSILSLMVYVCSVVDKYLPCSDNTRSRSVRSLIGIFFIGHYRQTCTVSVTEYRTQLQRLFLGTYRFSTDIYSLIVRHYTPCQLSWKPITEILIFFLRFFIPRWTAVFTRLPKTNIAIDENNVWTIFARVQTSISQSQP